jgi:hypothetical protein
VSLLITRCLFSDEGLVHARNTYSFSPSLSLSLSLSLSPSLPLSLSLSLSLAASSAAEVEPTNVVTKKCSIVFVDATTWASVAALLRVAICWNIISSIVSYLALQQNNTPLPVNPALLEKVELISSYVATLLRFEAPL